MKPNKSHYETPQTPKYKILGYLAQIFPVANRKTAKEQILHLTGLSVTSYNRKVTAKINDNTPSATFKPGHLAIVLDAINKCRSQKNQLKLEDLLQH